MSFTIENSQFFLVMVATFSLSLFLYTVIELTSINKWGVILSTLFIFLSTNLLVFYIMFIQYSKSLLLPNFIEFVIGFLNKNRWDIIAIIGNAVFSYIVAVSLNKYQKNQKKNILVWMISISVVAFSTSSYIFLTQIQDQKNEIPISIIENSYYTLPIDFLLEDREYFDNKLYEKVEPLNTLDSENNYVVQNDKENNVVNDNSRIESVDSSALQISYPQTLGENINLYYEEDNEEKSNKYLLRAYEIYKASANKNSFVKLDVAHMFYNLAYYNNDNDDATYFTKAKQLLLDIRDEYYVDNMLADVYYNLGEYNEAINYYRLCYQDNGYYKEQRILSSIIIMDCFASIEEIENEYNNIVSYFSDNEDISRIAKALSSRYYDFGQYDKAVSKYHDAIAFTSNKEKKVDLYLSCYRIFEEQNNYIAAKEELLSALSLTDDNSKELRNMIKSKYRALAKEVYFSDYSGKYDFVIECFNVCDPEHSEEFVYLYFQSLLRTNKPIELSLSQLEYFSGYEDSIKTNMYSYRPKMIIYCSGVYLKMGYEYKAMELLNKLDLIYDQKPNNFNDTDIVNYIQLLSRFRRNSKANEVFENTRGGEFSQNITNYRNILMTSIKYFGRRANEESITSNEANYLVSVLKNAEVADDNPILLKRVNFMTNLLVIQNGENINFDEILKILPQEKRYNRYLEAYYESKINRDHEKALDICQKILDDYATTPNEEMKNVVGFSKYDVFLLDANISLEYALYLSDNSSDREKIERYANRALQRFNKVNTEVGYLCYQSSLGIKKAKSLLGIPFKVDIPIKEL